MPENRENSPHPTMYLKTHSINKEVLVAVCDFELVGRTFSEGELHLYVNEQFFKGQPAGEDEVRLALAEATIANLVGTRAVSCGIDSGVVDKNCVIEIDGVPHAQMVLF